MCVFGAAILLDLYNLEKLKKTVEEARVRQQVRREAGGIAEIAEELYQIQGEFVSAAEFDAVKVTAFRVRYEQLQKHLQALYAQSLSRHERKRVSALATRAQQLYQLFFDNMVKSRREQGDAASEELSAALASARDIVEEMKLHHSNLSRILELKTHNAEYEAEYIWQLSLNLSRVTLGVALLTSLLVVYLTHRAIARPIHKLVEGTKALAAGDLTRRIDVPPSGEFRELAESFNLMTRALYIHQRNLVETERMATLGRFAAGIAHEINNPIAVILGYAKPMISRLPANAPELEGLKAIEEEARHCKNIVQGLLDLSRPAEEPEPVSINPKEVVSDVIALARTLGLTERVNIETSLVDRPLAMAIGRSRLRQIVLNIVTNALEELQGVGGGKLRIEGYTASAPVEANQETGPSPAEQERFLILRFVDNGPGIPEENINQLSEPFFTTKSKGTGLGLAITYSIVNAQGGQVSVASQEGEGATFVVSLPLSAET